MIDRAVHTAAACGAEDIPQAVSALPASARRRLAQGALPDPYCGVCNVVCPNGNCVAYGDAGDLLEGWHHASLSDVAPLLGTSVAALPVAQRFDPDLAARVHDLKARIGQARCEVIYRAAGWTPTAAEARAPAV